MHPPTLRFALELLGVVVSAVSGALAARGKRVDLFGVVVLALVTAVGGGTIRDLVLGAVPVFWVRDASFVLTAGAAALATFYWGRVGRIPHGVLQLADAGGLALFTAIGTEKSLSYGAAPVVAMVLGVVTGVAGGILRDSLTGEIPMVFRPEIYLYATAAFCGASLIVLVPAPAGEAACITVTLLLRLAALRWRIGLPVFKLREEFHPEHSQSAKADFVQL